MHEDEAYRLNQKDAVKEKVERQDPGLLQGITGYDSGEHPFIHEYQGHHITDLEGGGNNQGGASSLCRLSDNQGNSSEFQAYHTLMD